MIAFLVLAGWVALIVVALLIIAGGTPAGECTCDCDQGRRCTCKGRIDG